MKLMDENNAKIEMHEVRQRIITEEAEKRMRKVSNFLFSLKRQLKQREKVKERIEKEKNAATKRLYSISNACSLLNSQIDSIQNAEYISTALQLIKNIEEEEEKNRKVQIKETRKRKSKHEATAIYDEEEEEEEEEEWEME